MQKIVVKTDYVEENYLLITCLRLLFPECEIEVLPRQINKSEETSSDLEFSNDVIDEIF